LVKSFLVVLVVSMLKKERRMEDMRLFFSPKLIAPVSIAAV